MPQILQDCRVNIQKMGKRPKNENNRVLLTVQKTNMAARDVNNVCFVGYEIFKNSYT